MNDIADIHCHIVPYVDDGAMRREESQELLRMQYEQGVRTVCATPHLRREMFETPDGEIIARFEQMVENAGDLRKEMRFYLSREYHCDSGLVEKIRSDEVITMGSGNYLLIEFSHAFDEERAHKYVRLVTESGRRPLLAHIERFPALRESPDQIRRLIDMGAKIQMNAGSVLGREGRRQASWCKKLLKAGLVHVIASDAHDPEERPPELAACADHLEKKVGWEYARQLMHTNPLKILSGNEGEA